MQCHSYMNDVQDEHPYSQPKTIGCVCDSKLPTTARWFEKMTRSIKITYREHAFCATES